MATALDMSTDEDPNTPTAAPHGPGPRRWSAVAAPHGTGLRRWPALAAPHGTGLGRWPALAAIVVAGAVAGGWLALSHRPLAPIEARVLVEPTDAAADRARAGIDDRLIGAQIDLLTSRDLLRRATEVSGVAAEASGVFRPRGFAETIVRLFGRTADGDVDGLADELAAHLAVERVEHSRILALRLDQAEPEAGRRLLAAVVDRWTDALNETRTRARTDVDRRFGDEVAGLSTRLAEAEAHLALPVDERGGDAIEADLARARADRGAAETRLARLARATDGGVDALDAMVDTGATPALQRLRERRAQLRARRAELSVVYLEAHPLVREVDGALADLRREMRAEIPRAAAAERAALAAADARIADLEAERSAVSSGRVADDPETLRARLADLGRRRGAALAEALGVAAVDVRVVKPAHAGVATSTIGPVAAGAFGAAGGAGLALSFAALFGGTARRVRRMPAPALPVAAEPIAVDLHARAAERRQVRLTALEAELEPALRRMWPEILETIGTGGRIAVVAVASAEHGHAAARALVRRAAREDASVCLVDTTGAADAGAVDADGTEPLGFGDLLAGEATFSEVLHRDPGSHGWIVPAGTRPVDPAVLGDDGVAGILDALDLTYDHVVVDAGPFDADPAVATLLAGSDAVLLAGSDADPLATLDVLGRLGVAADRLWLVVAEDEGATASRAPVDLDLAA